MSAVAVQPFAVTVTVPPLFVTKPACEVLLEVQLMSADWPGAIAPSVAGQSASVIMWVSQASVPVLLTWILKVADVSEHVRVSEHVLVAVTCGGKGV